MRTEFALEYAVSMPNPKSHYFQVEIRISNFRNKIIGTPLQIIMPVWTPGSYLVREFSKNVLDLRAFETKEGREITSKKISKNTWEVDSGSLDQVLIKYMVYAFEFTVDTSYLDDKHGIINGASVFMFVRGLEQEPCILSVKPFPDWHLISCSLLPISQNANAVLYSASNFDELIDSPIEIGNQSIQTFSVNGIDHTVSIYSQEKFDWAHLVKDIKKIVESTVPIFGEIPYKRYTFLIDVSAADNYGGLEHLSSTHCIAPYFRMFPVQEYRQMLSLFSHEFFHAWNVKRMRPVGLGPFDYSNEVYTRSLWISEGVTSYYDDLILRRAGILPITEYLEAFATNIDMMSSLPGSKWESAEESSFDSWIKHYRPNENTPNIHASYYVQGAVIAWMIDMEIRRSTECNRCLDDVLRKVYFETYKNENRGFTDQEFEAACNDISEQSVSETIFDKRVRGKESVDFQKYLSYSGLLLKSKSEGDLSKGFLGLKMRPDAGRLVVSTVLSDTPAEAAGVASGDEVIAIDGLRVDLSKLSFLVANSSEGQEMDILFSRDGRLQNVRAITGQRPLFECRLYKKESASSEEKKLFNHWLGGDWDKELRYEEFVKSPIRKQPLDYI